MIDLYSKVGQETVWVNEDGMFRDFTIPEVLIRMTIRNAFLINQALRF